ncbi:GntR family transcriptional regulator [Gayadomonas joobiniege]|uniref:GntR family transcriptional regulator n=1 Tax=Gayadomonas joobiniege TaxID=1234606 RepID=UPI0003727015|nr:GntR family transcriptional regulator [Gayadomonas joobiniege]
MTSEKTYLFKHSVNRMLSQIQALSGKELVMPNDIQLTNQLNISRTTVRNCVDYLIGQGIIERQGSKKVVLRKPTDSDFFNIKNSTSSKDQLIEKYFLNLINTGQLVPGDRFSELSLARDSGCTTISVREFLIKFSNSGLIKKNPRGRWQMVEFDESFARELIAFREMVELDALNKLLTVPKDHSLWQDLVTLLDKHLALKADLKNSYQRFPDLDKEMHYKLREHMPNRFTDQFYDIVSFICHYHYQWDKQGEYERFSVAIDEHIDFLNHLIVGNHAGAILSMKRHLESAEKTLMRCVHGLEV